MHQAARTTKPAEEKRSSADRAPSKPPAAPNRTGLPDALKAGLEGLSGQSLDHVRVHRQSDKPAKLKAHAYAQGSEIHLGPGQEKHLPHEAWHVVQQAQGRVPVTTQMHGAAINDAPHLEQEADTMGARAAQETRAASGPPAPHAPGPGQPNGIFQLLSAEEQKSMETELAKIEAELPSAATGPDLYKLRQRVEKLLGAKFEDNATDRVLLARATKLHELVSAKWELTQPKKAAAPAPSSAAREKPDMSSLSKILGANSPGPAKPNFVIKPAKPAASSNTNAPAAPSRWEKVDASRVETPPTPPEKLAILGEHMKIPAEPSAVAAASETSRKLAWTVALSDKNIDALQPERIKSSRTLERDRPALAQWVVAEREFRALARSKGCKTTAEDLWAIIVRANTIMTAQSSKGALRTATPGGAHGPLLAHEMIETAVPPYCAWLASALHAMAERKISPIELAAQAYQRLNSIHPFADANGRVCNMIMDFVLLCGDLLPASLSGVMIAPLPSGERVASPGTKQLPTDTLKQVQAGVEASYAALTKPAAKPGKAAVAPQAEPGPEEVERRHAELTKAIAEEEAKVGEVEDKIAAISHAPAKERPANWVKLMTDLESQRHGLLARISALREMRYQLNR